MKVYDFGNKDVPEDKKAIEVAERLEDAIEGVSCRGDCSIAIRHRDGGYKMLSGLATRYQVGPPRLPGRLANLDLATGGGVKDHVTHHPDVRRTPPRRDGPRTPAPAGASGRPAWRGCSRRGCVQSWR